MSKKIISNIISVKGVLYRYQNSLGKLTCCSLIKQQMSSIHTSAQAKKIFACLGTNIGEQLKDNSSNWKKAKGIIILMDQKSNTSSLLIKIHY